MLQQLPEILVAMLVPSSGQMQMIVAELVLNDLFYLFPAVLPQLMGIDFDIMAFRKIPASGRGKPPVKGCLMPEWNAEAIQRYVLNPSLQLVIAHVWHNRSPTPFPLSCFLTA